MKIGVDFDGTLVKWHHKDQTGYIPSRVGEPIPKMIDLIKGLMANGHEIVIFTARVHPFFKDQAEVAKKAVQEFTLEQFGAVLEVTCMKDPRMALIIDDIAVSVAKDQGIITTNGVNLEEDDGDWVSRYLRR
jgi:hypothetical protein